MRFHEFNILKEFADVPMDPKSAAIIKDIKRGTTPVNVLLKLRSFLTKLVGQETVPEPVEPTQPAPAEPASPTPTPAIVPPKELVEPIEPELPPDEKQVKEARGKEKAVGSVDLQIYELMKKARPGDADKVWAFYNRSMLEEYIVPALNAKDIIKPDDHTRVLNLFIHAPGSLEDKVSVAMKIDDSGRYPGTGGGVIKTKDMLRAGAGSIDKLMTESNPTLDYIKKNLITFRVQPSTTAVNTGDGEAFFLILGSGIAKLGAGDLNVLGREVEVKAQGARLKGFGGKGVYGDGATYWTKFNKDLMSLIKLTGVKELYQETSRPPSKKNPTGTPGVDIRSEPLHFSAGNLAALSAVLAATKPGTAKVKAILSDALVHIYRKATPEMINRVLSTINSDGSFDVEEFRKQWFLLTYDYYMATSKDPKTGVGFDGILFIHQPSFSYSYIKNAKQIDSNWDNFELSPGLYNWTDAPSVAPKITYGKEIRQKRAPVAKVVQTAPIKR